MSILTYLELRCSNFEYNFILYTVAHSKPNFTIDMQLYRTFIIYTIDGGLKVYNMYVFKHVLYISIDFDMFYLNWRS